MTCSARKKGRSITAELSLCIDAGIITIYTDADACCCATGSLIMIEKEQGASTPPILPTAVSAQKCQLSHRGTKHEEMSVCQAV